MTPYLSDRLWGAQELVKRGELAGKADIGFIEERLRDLGERSWLEAELAKLVSLSASVPLLGLLKRSGLPEFVESSRSA